MGYFLKSLKYNDGLGIYLALTGQSLQGKNLVWCGLATHYVPSKRLGSLMDELSKQVSFETSDEEIEKLVARYSDLIVRGRIAGPMHQDERADIENIKEINEIFNQSSI